MEDNSLIADGTKPKTIPGTATWNYVYFEERGERLPRWRRFINWIKRRAGR